MGNLKKDSYLSTNIKYLLYFLVYSAFVIVIFLLFALNLSKTENIHSTSTDEGSVDVGLFNSNSIYNEESIKSYVNDLFSTRNSSFLDGNIEALYDFYTTNNSNSKHCLTNEFKRISYLRDWAIERGVIFTSISSYINLINIKDNGDSITLKVDEYSTFKYIYCDNNTPNTFKVNLLHILSLNKVDGSFKVEKDYYLDFLGNSSSDYPYKIKDNTLCYSKSTNKDFVINSSLKIGDILSYHKFTFVDHRGIVCGYDSKGYPLVNLTTINSSNIPYDLGWKEKNISKD